MIIDLLNSKEGHDYVTSDHVNISAENYFGHGQINLLTINRLIFFHILLINCAFEVVPLRKKMVSSAKKRCEMTGAPLLILIP